MPRLPPAEKLPLTVRKDIRDNWDSKKEQLEKNLSDILGEPWTINIDPKAIWPYGSDRSWAKESTGSMLAEYISGVEYQLKSFIDNYGEEAKKEINNIATAHSITMDLDEAKKFTYCGVEVSPAGELVILFTEGNLGTNISDALQRSNLNKALNEAPTDTNSLSYAARTDIRQEYTEKIAPVQEKINKILGKEITLDPNFEEVYQKLKASSNTNSGWQETLGQFTRLYFEGLNDYLEREKFGEDDMLQEGLTEALENNKVQIRVVDQLKKTWNEPIVEDGVLYLQTKPEYFGTNVSQIGDGLIDQL